jgi:hypothetical protein
MHCVQSIFVKSFRYCFIGPLMLGAALAAQQARAQDRTMRGDDHMMRGGDHGGMGGVGTGLAIGIGAGMMIDQLGKSQGAPDDKKNASKPKTDKTIAKKPPPKDTPKIKTPDNPPIKQTNAPPDQTPPATPIPPADGPPPTTTTDKPPDSPGVPPTQTATTPPPDQPRTPGTTPPEEPHDVPVPRKDYGHNRDEDCPQRGMGCAALIIDFQAKYLGDLTPLKDHLAADKACEVEFVTPHYLSGKELAAANTKLNANAKPGDPPANFNNREYQRLREAIDRHRQRVERGAELAIEIMRGEGYPAEIRTCGSVGPDGLGQTIDRQEFHAGNYQAANKHVCIWVVGDFSCYSGLTPQVFDELNNRGGLPQGEIKIVDAEGKSATVMGDRACQPSQSNNCATHAAWELDVAMGQSSSTWKACALFTPALRASLIGQFVRQGNSIRFDPSWAHHGFGSYYSDHGYRYCDPVVREGYTSQPPLSGKPDTIAPVSASSTTNRP